MLLKQIGFAIVLFFFTALILLALNFFPKNQASRFNVHPERQRLLIIQHMTNTHQKKLTHHFSHQHLFLLLKKAQQYHFIHTIQDLRQYDSSEDHIINQNDPIYNALYIGNYDPKSNQFRYLALSKSAIRAIKLQTDFDNEKLNYAEAILDTQHQNSANYHLVIRSEWFHSINRYT